MMQRLGQRLGAHAIAVAVLMIVVSALIWVGTGFAGYALYLAFVPRAGEPWAAAFAAAILVIGPVGWAAIMELRALRRPYPQSYVAEARILPAKTEDQTLKLLAKVAEDKPLLAILFAGILGASETILNRKQQP